MYPQFAKNGYCPPDANHEVARSGYKHDMWNLGVILYEMRFGRLPFGLDPQSESYKENMLKGAFETWPEGALVPIQITTLIQELLSIDS